jgi:hypothetical protein
MRKHPKILGLLAVALLAVTGLFAQGSGSFFTIDQGLGLVQLWSGGKLDIKSGAELQLAGTAITASAAELNKMDGVTLTAAQINEAGVTQTLTAATSVAADALVIPVTHEVVSKTTGADGEALTLADGSPGQVLVIVLVADGGGDGTLTPATATGWATIVFADAGDTVSLKFVDGTVGWVILGSAGVAAPPVITV